VPARQVVFFLALALILMIVILELVRRRELRIEYSWLWLASSATIIVLILRYDLLIALSRLVGVVIPTSALFFLCVLYLALLSLHYSIRISRFTQQIKDLAQEVAILRAELADAARASDGGERARRAEP
jgi:hypothetical protein